MKSCTEKQVLKEYIYILLDKYLNKYIYIYTYSTDATYTTKLKKKYFREKLIFNPRICDHRYFCNCLFFNNKS